ncbi:MAG: hypothetical protein WC782_14810 [Methylococcaceae bacterium]|jgi:hypothetical protein
MKKIQINTTKAIALITALFAFLLFPACDQSSTYVSEALGVVDSNNRI